MNIELLLRQYLYKNKSVAFPFIGKLVFGANAQLAESSDNAEVTPLQDLHFTFNLNEQMDQDFIGFVSSQTGKIKPLAAADVESYFMLSKQFINIGKAFVIDGIGSIEKQDNGTFAFTPGYYLPVSEASAAPHKPLKIREAALVVPKTDKQSAATTINKRIVFAGIGIVVLGLVAYGAYKLVTNKSASEIENPIAATDTFRPAPKDTTAPAAPQPATNTLAAGSFKAVVEERFTQTAATVRAAKLRTFGHDARVDSVAPDRFLIYVPVKDTTISIDTLKLAKITGKRPRFIPIQ